MTLQKDMITNVSIITGPREKLLVLYGSCNLPAAATLVLRFWKLGMLLFRNCFSSKLNSFIEPIPFKDGLLH